MIRTNAVEMPLWKARRAALAIIPHVSSDDVTPVLTVAQIADGYMIGTDRYSVGRIRLRGSEAPERLADESDDDFDARLERWQAEEEVAYFTDGARTGTPQEMLVPLAALRRISTLNASFLLTGKMGERHARVRLEAYDHRSQTMRGRPTEGYRSLDVVLIDGERPVLRQTFTGVVGNFPPVARLFDGWKPAEEGGTINFSTWNLSKITRFAERNDQIRFTPGAAKDGEKSHRLAPTRLEIGKDFTALLQPNLAL